MTVIVDSKLLFYTEFQKGKPMLNLFDTLAGLLKIIEYAGPDRVTEVVFVYDIGKSTYRSGMWSHYKNHRSYSHLPDGFKETYETIVKQIADALGIYSFPINGVEADDLAGILSNKIKGPVVLVTNDWDWKQLPIQYRDRVKLFYIRSWGLLDADLCIERTGCATVEQFLLKKAVLGDTGDRILGLPSIGPVKFKKWSDEAFQHPDVELKDRFLTLCRGTKKPATHQDYLEHAGISTCEELYDFNMALGRIMTGVKHLTVEQKVELNACWALYCTHDHTFDLAKVYQLSEDHSKGHNNPFGGPWSLAGSDLRIFERIHNDRLGGK